MRCIDPGRVWPPRLNDDDSDPSEGGGLLVEVAPPKLKKPPLYGVVMLNDDYTPMEFVVEVLEVFFSMDRTKATQIMLAVHTKGRAICGVYPKDVAETKAYVVNKYARESEHPLLCEIEPVEDSED